MTAVMLCGIQVGGSLWPLVSLLTLERFGWHVVLWLGGVTLLLAPFLQKYLPADTRERSEGRSAAAPPGSALFRVGARRNHFCFWTACFMTLFLIYGLGTWLPELMLRSGNSMDSSLIFPIVMNIGGIIGSFLFASLADRKLGARKTLVALYVLSAVSVYALGIHAPAPALFAVLFLAGAGVFGAQNIANAYVSAYYPASLRTTGLGWYNGIGRAGAICGSAVWGILLEWSLPVPTTFLIFALPALAGGLAFLSVREKMDPGMKPE
jgi:AAHS family benzoate transporter-like MFS transporter